MENIRKLQDYAEYLKNEVEGADLQIADTIAERLRLHVARVNSLLNDGCDEWKVRIIRLFEDAREAVNIILSIYNPDTGFVPKCISRLVADFAVLHGSILGIAQDDEHAKILAENTALFVDELCEGNIYVQDREKWFESGYVQNVIKNRSTRLPNQSLVDCWYNENINLKANLSVLTEEEVDLLKSALDNDKTIGTAVVQRRFSYGYVKALSVIDRMEQAGIISTFEQTKDIGFSRILRVTKEMLDSVKKE